MAYWLPDIQNVCAMPTQPYYDGARYTHAKAELVTVFGSCFIVVQVLTMVNGDSKDSGDGRPMQAMYGPWVMEEPW